MALATALLLTGCDDAWSRGQLDLNVFTSEHYNYEGSYFFSVDVTDEVCGPVTDCVQAVRSDYFTWTKFASVESAGRYAKKLGNRGVQIDPLVLDFDGAPVSEAEREEIIEVASGFNASSPD